MCQEIGRRKKIEDGLLLCFFCVGKLTREERGCCIGLAFFDVVSRPDTGRVGPGQQSVAAASRVQSGRVLV